MLTTILWALPRTIKLDHFSTADYRKCQSMSLYVYCIFIYVGIFLGSPLIIKGHIDDIELFIIEKRESRYSSKGQLILKCPYGVFKSPKKPTKFFPGFLP